MVTFGDNQTELIKTGLRKTNTIHRLPIVCGFCILYVYI